MTTRILIGLALAASAALGAFAATGFGEGGDSATAVSTERVDTHVVPGPDAGPQRVSKGGSLFSVIYKSTRSLNIPDGVTVFDLGSCPVGGAVLSAWHLRGGDNKSGLLATGSTPTTNSRRMDYVITNTTGDVRKGKLGIVCIK